MQLNQLIDLLNPVAHWTGERYGGTNVYDEYDTHTLVNNNATLGATGTANANLSNRSINLNGGYLQVLDTTFNEVNVASRQFVISFGFRVPGRLPTNPIAGFKPIVSKWNPEQQYMVGFENGKIVAKVQTVGGLIELEHDLPQVIYNDRWNWVQLRVSTTDVHLHLNGIGVSVSDSSAAVASTNSLFTIGGIGAEAFGEDVLVNNISVCNTTNTYFDEASYILPRSDAEMWLNMAPAYYFAPGEALDPTQAIPNLGTKGGHGYIVYDPAGDAPYLYEPSSLSDEKTVRLPSGSWFTIDTDDLEFNTNEGLSLAFRGRFDQPDSNSNPYNAMRVMDLRNNLSDNNGRIYLSHNYYSSGSRDWFYWKGYDAAGAETAPGEGYATYNDAAHSYTSTGVKMYSLKGGDLDTVHYQFGYWSATKTYNNMGLNYNKTLPIASNRFWYNTGANGCAWTDLREFALFNYDVPQEFLKLVNYPRYKLRHFFIYALHTSSLAWNAHGYSSTTPNLREHETRTSGPYAGASGHSFATAIVDANNNRHNEFLGASYLSTTSAYTGGSTSQDDIFIQNSDFTISAFLWNRNTTGRYRFMHNTSGIDLEFWMNSRDGQFSYGDIECSVDNMAADETLSTFSRTFKDNGFHHMVFVRKGFELQIWVDGKLETTLITSVIHNLDYTNTTLRMYGGPLYFNEWTVWMHNAMTPAEVEYLFGGFNDVLKGQCTLDGAPLPSTLIAASTHNGEALKTYATGSDGKFDLELPKSIQNRRVNILALAQDDNASNNVVVHGPYNMNTVYSKYSDEVLEQSLADMILDMNPYAYYPMNDTSGTTITDASPNARHGTLTGGVTLDQPAMESGSRAVDFNGTDGYIDLPDGYNDFSTGFTFEAWVNYDAFNNYSRIFEFSTAELENYILLSNSTTTNTGLFYTRAGSSGNLVTLSQSSMFNASTWQHVAVRIAPNGDHSMWVNGTKVQEGNGTVPPAVLRTLNYLGRSTSPTDGYYNGQMSQVATYDFPLSDEDIEKHAKRGFGRNMPTLKSAILQDGADLYFPFDRADSYKDAIDGVITLTQNGSFDIVKNALVVNKDTTANNWLTTPDHRLVDNGEGWTIEFSVKTGITHTDAVIISEWDQASDTGTYKAMLDGSNKLKFFVTNGSTVMESTTLFNDDAWHHVMIVFDGNTTTMYVDGDEEATISVSYNYNLHNLAIGNTSDGHTSMHFEGTAALDDVAIYSHELGLVRVTEHYNRFIKKKVYQ